MKEIDEQIKWKLRDYAVYERHHEILTYKLILLILSVYYMNKKVNFRNDEYALLSFAFNCHLSCKIIFKLIDLKISPKAQICRMLTPEPVKVHKQKNFFLLE